MLQEKWSIQRYENGEKKENIPMPNIYTDKFIDMLNYVKNLDISSPFYSAHPAIQILMETTDDHVESDANALVEYIKANVSTKSYLSGEDVAFAVVSNETIHIESAIKDTNLKCRENDHILMAIVLHPSVNVNSPVMNELLEISKTLSIPCHPEMHIPIFMLTLDRS